ncbi:MAG: TrkH family potassium uptake protein [Planctomycetota bacterium]|jgi:trk system potassium uptake protein TrkH
MRLRHVFAVLGHLLRPFAILLLVPAAVDFGYGNLYGALGFCAAAIVSFLFGRLLSGRERVEAGDLVRVEAMAVVASAWLMAALIGSLPYLQQGLGFVDALFESMSGFTTTGSTIFMPEHWSSLTKGLFFWRAMTQWLGGMGIIVLFVAVLPALAVAGRQMFFAEAPGPEEAALTPRIRHTAMALWRLYIALTVLQALLLRLFGNMTLYEGVCHAFTTLAAGGFSPNGRSLAGYGATAQWIVIPFMFLAGASFALQFRALRSPRVFGRDTEFRAYFMLVIFAGLIIAVLLAGTPGHGFESSLRHGFFQAVSILTTTGYASEDFNLWSQGALMVLGALMFIGGCAGSAGGGPKVVRIVVLAKFLAREVLVVLHPRAVRAVRIGGRPLQMDTMRQIVGFAVAYLAVFSVVAVLAGIIENDFAVGVTGSIVTLGNIGPGFGRIGPMETFGDLSVLTKILFILSMWVGRLEVMTVLILFHPELMRTLFQKRSWRGANRE